MASRREYEMLFQLSAKMGGGFAGTFDRRLLFGFFGFYDDRLNMRPLRMLALRFKQGHYRASIRRVLLGY